MHSDYLQFAAVNQSDAASVVQANLAETDERLSHLYCERAFHLSELIRELSLSPQIDELTLSAITEQLPANTKSASPYGTATAYADIAMLCCEFAGALPNGFDRVFSDVFGQPLSPLDTAIGRVAYVPNSYTEQAFGILCASVPGCSASYHHHFDDVCQEVYNGLCQYGILPISSSPDGMLSGIYRMIASYRLKITSVCRIAGGQDAHTVFALIERCTAVPEKPCDCCMEFLYTPANAHDVTDLLCITALFGHRVLGTGSYTAEDGEAFHIRLAILAQAFYPYLIYLSLFCQDMIPVGLYQIES